MILLYGFSLLYFVFILLIFSFMGLPICLSHVVTFCIVVNRLPRYQKASLWASLAVLSVALTPSLLWWLAIYQAVGHAAGSKGGDSPAGAQHKCLGLRRARTWLWVCVRVWDDTDGSPWITTTHAKDHGTPRFVRFIK